MVFIMVYRLDLDHVSSCGNLKWKNKKYTFVSHKSTDAFTALKKRKKLETTGRRKYQKRKQQQKQQRKHQEQQQKREQQ